jgi:hypothetical protein
VLWVFPFPVPFFFSADVPLVVFLDVCGLVLPPSGISMTDVPVGDKSFTFFFITFELKGINGA